MKLDCRNRLVLSDSIVLSEEEACPIEHLSTERSAGCGEVVERVRCRLDSVSRIWGTLECFVWSVGWEEIADDDVLEL